MLPAGPSGMLNDGPSDWTIAKPVYFEMRPF